MPTVAYLTNQFPSVMEWYVVEEIRELRKRGATVIPCSSRRVDEHSLPPEFVRLGHTTLYLEPLRPLLLLGALWTCFARIVLIRDLLREVLVGAGKSPSRHIRTLVHTLLGAYFALLLRGRGVQHIHVHHGYFSCWIAMVAARFLGITFSMTLHGSDLLLHAAHMDTKLAESKFCLTVSEFNRRHILAHYPSVDASKILVQRIGVPTPVAIATRDCHPGVPPVLLAVGRLHPVKNHAFLLEACARLRQDGLDFRCVIVGDGPERHKLALLIHELRIEDSVVLVGHVPHDGVGYYYQSADVIVLTSHSEGIPLVLMEAMAHGKIVLAPAITGIPELVIDGKTGFLYKPAALEEFVLRAQQICSSLESLQPIRRSARDHVREHFNQRKNLEHFAGVFLRHIEAPDRSCTDENLILQQV